MFPLTFFTLLIKQGSKAIPRAAEITAVVKYYFIDGGMNNKSLFLLFEFMAKCQ